MQKFSFLLPLLLFVFANCGNSYPEEEQPLPWIPHEVLDLPGKRYGVRWQSNNPYDLGERCLDAEGLDARFGIGALEGHSDFDQVYPWREIRRCNVKKEGSETIITFDDDPAFTIDGSNGDVFVRIPKFYVEKYNEGGYEYRVISAHGDKPHPAFIENGQELDAIYVSAFEGYIDKDGLLYSIADVIPTTNIPAQVFLDAARRRGPQYTLYDMRTVDLLFTLMAVEFGCRNSGVSLGHGIADYRQPLEDKWDTNRIYYSQKDELHTNSMTCKRQKKEMIPIGSNICVCQGNQRDILTFARLTDKIDTPSTTTYYFDGPPIDITTDCFIGSCAQSTNWIETCSAPHNSYMGRANMTEKGFLPTERNPMRYRWMENIVGNVWHFLPDITFKDCQMYVCSNIKDYCFARYEGGYQPFGSPLEINEDNGSESNDMPYYNYWVTTLMEDNDGKGVSFGMTYDKSLTSKEAFGAYYYVKDGLKIVVNGGGFDHKNRCNVLTTRAWVYPDTRWHLYGARLLFKDL